MLDAGCCLCLCLPPLGRPHRLLSPPLAAHVSVCETVWNCPPRYAPFDQIPRCQSAVSASGPAPYMAPQRLKMWVWGRQISGRAHAP
eukprot:scaffold5075_cov109-Isochrysis_galbana.AAC.6